ncbi:DExH-box ATP-dependent RNA helicase DExH1 [Linum grandiflorum]
MRINTSICARSASLTTLVPAPFSLNHFLPSTPTILPSLLFHRPRISISPMSYRPNSQGGRRGGGGGRGGRGGGGRGGRGGGGGGRGEQRWWDPVWRAERLRQNAAELEVLDENEWWSKIEQMKSGREQEMIVKRSFSRADQEKLSGMAYQVGLHFHAYNKGKTLVVSKVPLPNYRADLDERHGSTQNEIRMSTETERRVGSLLGNSRGQIPGNGSGSTYSHDSPQSSRTVKVTKPIPVPSQKDSAKEKLSLELKQKQDELRASNGVKEIRSFRQKLPAFKAKAEFLKAVTDNQVLVISGETGCGKTTQLPQYILEEEISALRGGTCSIICTQPRRISAISVAARVSSERGETLGESVGYQIRLESKRSALTRLLFCTTGVLLRQLVQDPNLTGVTHLLVDEIHERGMNEDFLLIILRDLLPRRPDLRLILMSATINANLFSKYFGNAPTIHIPGFTFPVAEFFLEDLLEKSRYKIQPESENMQGNSRRTRRRRDQESKKDPLMELFEDIDIDSHYKNYSASTRLSLEAWSGLQLDLGRGQH